MSKTVHPYSFRLGILRDWRSRWFNPIKYRHLLKADVLIREALEKSMRGNVCGGHRDRKVSGDFSFDNQNFPPGLLIGGKEKEPIK